MQVLKITLIFVLKTNKNSNIMPEVLRLFGYSFMFYSNEHEPIHIHVVGKGGNAKFTLSDESNKFIMTENFKIKKGDMNKIQTVINENADLFNTAWKSFFSENTLQ